MVAARGGTVWSNPRLGNNPYNQTVAPSSPIPMVAAQTSDPVGNQLTYPGPPPGFSQLVFYGSPEIASWPDYATVQVIDLTIWTPTQVSADEWMSIAQSIHDGLPTIGDDLLGYEIDEQPLVNISVPDQVCIPDPFGGSPFCITPPGGGTTIQVGFAYRLWAVIGSGSGQSSGYRAAVRAQGFIAVMGYVIAAIQAFLLILNVTGVSQNSTAISNLKGDLQTIIDAPGQNIAAAEAPLNTTLLIVGVGSVVVGILAVLHGQQPPPVTPISVGGNVSGPGGIGFGGGFSEGGGAPVGGSGGSRRGGGRR